MFSVEEAEKIPHRELRSKRLVLLFRRHERDHKARRQPARRTPIMPTRNAKQIRNWLFPFSFQQPERDSTPETPAPKIFLRQSLGRHVVIDLQLGQIHSLRATREQPVVKLLIFT